MELPRARTVPSFNAVMRTHVPQNDVSNMVVLLIENDNELRSALTITMEQWSVDVLTCKSHQEAQELLEEIDLTPDVIVADYQLDDAKDGLDAMRR